MAKLPLQNKEEKPKEEKEPTLMGDTKFAGRLIYYFEDYLIQQTPSNYLLKKGKKDFTFILGIFQKRYEYLKKTEKWDESMMKTVIWNMCLNQEPYPLKIETYIKYENKYYSGRLVDYERQWNK